MKAGEYVGLNPEKFVMQSLLSRSKRNDYRLRFTYREFAYVPPASPVYYSCESVHGFKVSNDLHTFLIWDVAFGQSGTYSDKFRIVAQNSLTPRRSRSLIKGLS
jgi:hypothetical protein